MLLERNDVGGSDLAIGLWSAAGDSRFNLHYAYGPSACIFKGKDSI